MIARHLALVLAVLAGCGAKTNPTPVGTEPATPPAAAPEPTPAPAPTPTPTPTPTPADAGGTCGTRGASPCPTGQFCSYGPGDDCGASDKPGHCMAKPRMCPHLVAPVCGCDGKTHNNGCEAAQALTGVKANGACKP